MTTIKNFIAKWIWITLAFSLLLFMIFIQGCASTDFDRRFARSMQYMDQRFSEYDARSMPMFVPQAQEEKKVNNNTIYFQGDTPVIPNFGE